MAGDNSVMHAVSRDPVAVYIVGRDPPVVNAVGGDVDFSTARMGVCGHGEEDGEKGEEENKSQPFHVNSSCLRDWNIFRVPLFCFKRWGEVKFFRSPGAIIYPFARMAFGKLYPFLK